MAVELGQANYEASLSLQVNLDPPPVETFLSLDQAQEIMHHVDPAYYTVIQDIGLQKWAANCFQGRIPNSPSVRYIPTARSLERIKIAASTCTSGSPYP